MIEISGVKFSAGRVEFDVVTQAAAVELFDFLLGFDPEEVDLAAVTVTGPAGWSVVQNTGGPGELLIGGFSSNFTPVVAGSLLLKVSVNLKSVTDTAVAMTLEGVYNDPPITISTETFTLTQSTSPFGDTDATGKLSVIGSAEEGGSLTASLSEVFDVDGAITVAYRWQEFIGGEWTDLSMSTWLDYSNEVHLDDKDGFIEVIDEINSALVRFSQVSSNGDLYLVLEGWNGGPSGVAKFDVSTSDLMWFKKSFDLIPWVPGLGAAEFGQVVSNSDGDIVVVADNGRDKILTTIDDETGEVLERILWQGGRQIAAGLDILYSASNTYSSEGIDVYAIEPSGGLAWSAYLSFDGRDGFYDSVSDMVVNPDGVLYLGGHMGAGFVARIESAGNIAWVTSLGDLTGSADRLALDSSGGIYAIGTNSPPDQIGSFGVLTALDSEGDIKWSKQIPNAGTLNTQLNSLLVDHDENVVIAGTQGTEGGNGFLLAKFSPSGEEIWSKSVVGDGHFGPISIELNDDNSICVITSSYDGSVQNVFSQDVQHHPFILKFGPDGKVISSSTDDNLDEAVADLIGTITLTIPGHQSFVNRQVRVVATTTDALGGTTTFEGAAETISNVDDLAIGTLRVIGTAQKGSSLTASLSDVVDADGAVTIVYHWQELVNSDWTELSDSTDATFLIPDDQSFVGRQVRVVATTTDVLGGTTKFEGNSLTISDELIFKAGQQVEIILEFSEVIPPELFYDIRWTIQSGRSDYYQLSLIDGRPISDFMDSGLRFSEDGLSAALKIYISAVNFTEQIAPAPFEVNVGFFSNDEFLSISRKSGSIVGLSQQEWIEFQNETYLNENNGFIKVIDNINSTLVRFSNKGLDGDLYLVLEGWNGGPSGVAKYDVSASELMWFKKSFDLIPWVPGLGAAEFGQVISNSDGDIVVLADNGRDKILTTIDDETGEILERTFWQGGRQIAAGLDILYSAYTSEGINVVAIDPSGRLEWNTNISFDGPDSFYDSVSDMAVNPDGVLYLGGHMRANSEVPYGGFVARIESAGNIAWVTSLGDLTGSADRLAIDSSGGIYAIGSSSPPDQIGSFGVLTALDSEGDIKWSKQIPNAGILNTQLNSLLVDHDENVVIAGTQGMQGGNGFLLAKFSPSGAQIWSKSVVGDGHFGPISIELNDDNSISLITSSYDGSVKEVFSKDVQHHPFILRFGTNGEIFGSSTDDKIDGSFSDDVILSLSGNDLVSSGGGNDKVDAGDGNDLIVGGDGAGDDTYLGGDGVDTVRYTSAVTGITVDLALGTATGAEIGTDTLTGIENVIGGQAGDTLTGDDGDNVIDGYTGDDLISAMGGDDTLKGAEGDDTLLGGAGHDTALFEFERSAYSIEWSVATQRLSVSSASEGTDTLEDIETLRFSDVDIPVAELQTYFDSEATGALIVTGAAEEGGSLNATLNDVSDANGATITAYRWQELVSNTWSDLTGATAAELAIPDDQSFVGKEVRAVATTTDVVGGTTTFKSAGQTVANVDDEATGILNVGGTAEEGGSLTAALSGVSDSDGTTTTAYRWQELVNSTWTDLSGATAATLSIPADQSFVGKQVRVVATTTDVLGGTTTFESTTQTVANLDDEATGTLSVTGTAEEGGLLTAALSGLSDADGSATVAYRWQTLVNTAWTDLSGATGAALTIPADQSFVGKQVRVVATATDAPGGTTTFESAAQTVANVDDEATGTIGVTGETIIGSLLTAMTANLQDADGPVKSSSWQWQRGSADGSGAPVWTDIPGATETTLAIPTAPDQLGAAFRVVLTTVDSTGGSTTLVSESTERVEGVLANLSASFWVDSTPIANVLIQTGNGNGQVRTGQNGQGTLHGIAGPSLTFSPQKTVTTEETPAAAQAVTLQDAVAILKMLAGQTTAAADLTAERARSWAADFDSSGTVSLADAIGVLRHAVGLPAPAPSWVFFTEDDASSDSNPTLQPGIPQPITVAVTPPNVVEIDMIGVLRGDVDGSWDPNRFGVSGG